MCGVTCGAPTTSILHSYRNTYLVFVDLELGSMFLGKSNLERCAVLSGVLSSTWHLTSRPFDSTNTWSRPIIIVTWGCNAWIGIKEGGCLIVFPLIIFSLLVLETVFESRYLLLPNLNIFFKNQVSYLPNEFSKSALSRPVIVCLSLRSMGVNSA